jgi:hypothetical protein
LAKEKLPVSPGYEFSPSLDFELTLFSVFASGGTSDFSPNREPKDELFCSCDEKRELF